jgi:hypothetical protein
MNCTRLSTLHHRDTNLQNEQSLYRKRISIWPPVPDLRDLRSTCVASHNDMHRLFTLDDPALVNKCDLAGVKDFLSAGGQWRWSAWHQEVQINTGFRECEQWLEFDSAERPVQSLDNQLTESGKVVSHTHRPRSTPQKHYFYASGTHLCSRLSKPQGLVRMEGLGKWKNPFTSSGLEPATCQA